jgi:hypothetical protein
VLPRGMSGRGVSWKETFLGWKGGRPSLGGEAGSASGGSKESLRQWTKKESVLDPCWRRKVRGERLRTRIEPV